MGALYTRCLPDSHHFYEEQDPDPQQSEKRDPDPHYVSAPILFTISKYWIRYLANLFVFFLFRGKLRFFC